MCRQKGNNSMRRYNLHYDHFEYMITITSYNHDVTVVATRVLCEYYYHHYHYCNTTATTTTIQLSYPILPLTTSSYSSS